MASDLHLAEWEKLVDVIGRMVIEESEIITILGVKTVMKIRAQLEEATANKREEISAKREREKIKRDEEDEERNKKLFYCKLKMTKRNKKLKNILIKDMRKSGRRD